MRQIGRRSNTPPPVVAAAVFSVPYHYANGIAATWDTIDRYSGKLTALPFMFPEARQAYLYVSRLYRILKAKGQI